MEKPQILAHIQKSLNYTLFDSKWIPSSAKFVVLGNHARGTGALQIYEISHGDAKMIAEVCKFLKCALIRFKSFLIRQKNRVGLSVEPLERLVSNKDS